MRLNSGACAYPPDRNRDHINRCVYSISISSDENVETEHWCLKLQVLLRRSTLHSVLCSQHMITQVLLLRISATRQVSNFGNEYDFLLQLLALSSLMHCMSLTTRK
jgi:hypothetical protein